MLLLFMLMLIFSSAPDLSSLLDSRDTSEDLPEASLDLKKTPSKRRMRAGQTDACPFHSRRRPRRRYYYHRVLHHHHHQRCHLRHLLSLSRMHNARWRATAPGAYHDSPCLFIDIHAKDRADDRNRRRRRPPKPSPHVTRSGNCIQEVSPRISECYLSHESIDAIDGRLRATLQ